MNIHFSYGSNMDVAAMRQRCPDARPTSIARLRGWQFFIAASGYASLRRRTGADVSGVLWQVNDADLQALDLYEDIAGGLYRKVRLSVEARGRRSTALVYLTRDSRTGKPHPGYQEAIVAAAEAWRFPEPAMRDLEAWLPSRRRRF